MALNGYVDEAAVRAQVEAGAHRSAIGGLWEEVGELQLSHLKQAGLAPQHNLLDLGCGSLRAGVLLAAYLEPGRYHGIDASRSLLEAGRRELELANVSDRVPEHNLRLSAEFDASGFPAFDFGIAQSLFTHLPIDFFALALKRVRPSFAPAGRLYVTFFTAGRDEVERVHETRAAPGSLVTYAHKDPYHYAVDAILQVAEATDWRPRWIGDWNHPRDQQIAEFTLL